MIGRGGASTGQVQDRRKESVVRAHVVVRAATPDDLPDLVALWHEQRSLSARSERVVPEPTAEGALQLLARAQSDGATRVVVATLGEAVAGLAVMRHEPFAALFDVQSVHLHYLHVREGFRRRGVGHALVAAAAAFAEEVGAEHVVSDVLPQLREANRFYARLGFGPVVVQRVASVPALRRRLGAGRRQAPLDELLSRRRSVRSRAQLVAVDPVGSTTASEHGAAG